MHRACSCRRPSCFVEISAGRLGRCKKCLLEDEVKKERRSLYQGILLKVPSDGGDVVTCTRDEWAVIQRLYEGNENRLFSSSERIAKAVVNKKVWVRKVSHIQDVEAEGRAIICTQWGKGHEKLQQRLQKKLEGKKDRKRCRPVVLDDDGDEN